MAAQSGKTASSPKPKKDKADIILTVTHLDGTQEEKPLFRIECHKRITMGDIKDRISAAWMIPKHEQVIVFRGQVVNKDDRAMPLNTPDLAEIIKEAGENGLQMAVLHKPEQLPGFLEREGFENLSDKRTSLATPLHKAVRRSELSVMEEILSAVSFEEAPEVVDGQDNAGQTALHVAASTWNRSACEILLQSLKFSASDVVDDENRTALHIAASWGDAPAVGMILAHWNMSASTMRLKDALGRTALEYAVACGHEEAAECIRKSLEEGSSRKKQEAMERRNKEVASAKGMRNDGPGT